MEVIVPDPTDPLTTCVGTPFTMTVVMVVTPPRPPPTTPPATPATVPGGGGVGIGMRLTLARRIGVPESAATTRPRMTPFPTGSGGGRRPGSRGGCPTCEGTAGRGGGGG